MLLKKRISKPSRSFKRPNPRPKQTKKAQIKSKKTKEHKPRCSYQIIPSPAKFSYSSSVHHLYGDMAIMQQNGSFISDLSLLNNFKRYQSALVHQIGREKVITIFPESLNNSDACEWASIIEELEEYDDKSLLEWSKVIGDYCQDFEQVIKKQLKKKKIRTLKEKETVSETTKATEKKKLKLIEEHPCICLKRRFKGADLQLTEISFSEKYLTLLGYSVNSFISTVLREGIPRIEVYEPAENMKLLRALVESIKIPDQQDIKAIEYKSLLMLKYGYTREITYRVQHLPTYEDGLFGLDMVFAVTSKETPQINNILMLNSLIRSDFLETAISEDEEAARFLKVYYNEEKAQRYKCMNKVCKVRDIITQTISYEDSQYVTQFYVKSEGDFEVKEETVKEEDYSNSTY